MVDLAFEVLSEEISLYQLTKDFAEFFGYSERNIYNKEGRFFVYPPENINQSEKTKNVLSTYKKNDGSNKYVIEFNLRFYPSHEPRTNVYIK